MGNGIVVIDLSSFSNNLIRFFNGHSQDVDGLVPDVEGVPLIGHVCGVIAEEVVEPVMQHVSGVSERRAHVRRGHGVENVLQPDVGLGRRQWSVPRVDGLKVVGGRAGVIASSHKVTLKPISTSNCYVNSSNFNKIYHCFFFLKKLKL